MRGVVGVALDIVGGFLVASAVMAAILFVRFVIAYANADGRSPFQSALSRTGKWTFGLVAGVFSTVAVGLVQFGDLVGMTVGFIVGHPYFASNFGVAGVGAGALSGMWTLTAQQYLGVALAIVGLVFLVVEVDDAV